MSSGLLLGLSLFLASARAADPAALVQRLASDSFEVRMQAEEELLKLGSKAEDAVRKGLTSSDAQVREQCRQILSKIQQAGRETRFQAFLADMDDRLTPSLPGWKRFAALAGNGPAQRKQFLDLYQHAEAGFDEIERDPKKAGPQLAARITAARTALLTSSKEDEVLREVLVMLLVAGDPRLALDAKDFNRVCGVLTILAERSAIVKAFHANVLIRRTTWDFLKDRGNSSTQAQTATVALALGLPEARDWAMQMIQDRKQPGLVRGWSVLLAAKVGGKEAIAKLEPLLSDTTVIGTFQLGKTKLTTELGDVTLAVLLQSSGQKPEMYGFPYFQAVPGLKSLPSPDRLGFADAATRQAAHKKWQASRK